MEDDFRLSPPAVGTGDKAAHPDRLPLAQGLGPIREFFAGGDHHDAAVGLSLQARLNLAGAVLHRKSCQRNPRWVVPCFRCLADRA